MFEKDFEVAGLDQIVLLMEVPEVGCDLREEPIQVSNPAESLRLHGELEARVLQKFLADFLADRVRAIHRDQTLNSRYVCAWIARSVSSR